MNKKILRTLTALCAALMLTGGFSVTAFAQTPEDRTTPTTAALSMRNPKRKNPLPRTERDPCRRFRRQQATYHSDDQKRQLLLYPH